GRLAAGGAVGARARRRRPPRGRAVGAAGAGRGGLDRVAPLGAGAAAAGAGLKARAARRGARGRWGGAYEEKAGAPRWYGQAGTGRARRGYELGAGTSGVTCPSTRGYRTAPSYALRCSAT